MSLKKSVIILCVFLYVITAIQPILPLIEYNLNYDYIVNKLCVDRGKLENYCQGQCHLKNQLNKAQNEGQDKQIPYNQLTKKDISEYLFDLSDKLAGSFQPEYYIYLHEQPGYLLNIYKDIFHPPEVVIFVC